MLYYQKPHVPKPAGLSVSYLFASIALTTSCCLAEHLLLVVKRAVHRHGLASAHMPHHSTPGGERAPPTPPHSLFLSPSFSSRIIHSRAKSQSLSLSLSVCLYGSVNLPPPSLYYSPLYHLPSLSAWVGEGKKNSWYLWCFVESRGTEWHRTVSQSISEHESCGCIRKTEVQRENAIKSREGGTIRKQHNSRRREN